MLRLCPLEVDTYSRALYARFVPPDHPLRRLDEAVDFAFVPELVADRYDADNGRPAWHPEQMWAGRLSDRAVALVVKRAAAAAGFDVAQYAGHSLRAGLATAAAAANVPERVIAQQTRHKSLEILRRYIRAGSLFTENAAAAVGL